MIVRVCVIFVVAVTGLAAFGGTAGAEEGEEALGQSIERALRAGGPYFTGAEQAVINRACGYAPGEWDGYAFRMNSGVLRCENGRDVDDPAVRRVFRQAGPRISRRVETVMARPEIIAAIDRIADEATAAALRDLDPGNED
jgi:hypothetical protein